MKTTKVKAASLILDFTLYPRQQVDGHHVSEMRAAMEANVTLPPVIADRKSKRVTDGFHRVRATLMDSQDAEIEVEYRDYKNDAEMFIDAMRMNSGHGRNLTSYDKSHCLIRAMDLKVAVEIVAEALSITVDRAAQITTSKAATVRVNSRKETVPLKRTISHMAGKTLTGDQQQANRKLGGMAQLFYVNQLLLLIDNGLIDRKNEDLMAGLGVLHEKLEEFVGELVV